MNEKCIFDPRFLAEIEAAAPFSAPEGYRPPHALSGLPASTPLLLGYSGGADSSVLLFLTARYAREHGTPLRILHLHHGIRGEEADRDADFAASVANAYGIPLTLVRRDVPKIAKERGESLETAARRVRYEVFRETMREHAIPLLLTAHNATDSLETVLHRLLRGSGLSGLCGIPPVRAFDLKTEKRHNRGEIVHNNNGPLEESAPVPSESEGTTALDGLLLRPLLETPREAIERFAAEHRIPFVTDSTNADTAYTRNRIREDVLPLLRTLTPSPEKSVARMTASLREDRDCLDALARDLRARAETAEGLDRRCLSDAPDPIVRRVLLSEWQSAVPHLDTYESVHIESLLHLARNGRNGTHLSLPRSVATLERDRIRILPREIAAPAPAPDFEYTLAWGETYVPERGFSLGFGRLSTGFDLPYDAPPAESCKITKNIYNSATQIYIQFDTIDRRLGDAPLTVRPRRPGDRILTRGMHRSLRTLTNEAHLTKEERDRLTVIAHGDEILWIPGLAVRDGLFLSAETARRACAEGSDVLVLSLLPLNKD